MVGWIWDSTEGEAGPTHSPPDAKVRLQWGFPWLKANKDS